MPGSGNANLTRNDSMDGAPIAVDSDSDPDPDAEVDELAGDSETEAISTSDAPQYSKLNSSGDEPDLPDLAAKPSAARKTKVSAAKKKASAPAKQDPASNKPVSRSKARVTRSSSGGSAKGRSIVGPKSNSDKKGKKKTTRPVASPPSSPPPPAPSPSASPEPPPRPKKRARRRSKSEEDDRAASVLAAPEAQTRTVIAHVEIQQTAQPQQASRARPRSKQAPLPNIRLPSFRFPVDADYPTIRQSLAELAQVAPVFLSSEITWKFMTPTSSPTQPLTNDISMEALKRQLEGRIAKKQELVVLIVMGPTLSGTTISTIAPAPIATQPSASEETDQSRVASVDNRISSAAKMVKDHYPPGRCLSHPDIACVCHENLHWELTDIRCKVWGNQIVAGKATIDRPPIGSAFFKPQDVIKKRLSDPPTTPVPASTPSTLTSTHNSTPFFAQTPVPAAQFHSSAVAGAFGPTWPMPQYPYMPYPPAFPYPPPVFTPSSQPPFFPTPPQSTVPVSAFNPPSSPAGPSCDFDKFCEAAKLSLEDKSRLREMDFVPGQKLSKIPKEVWESSGIRQMTFLRIKEADRLRKDGRLL
ncbi:hypothetical protein FRB90_004098 [Tulasnella sp. 427]|nr:hypothetical protein FRB90_004098 [Tulasnella sp. 427]